MNLINRVKLFIDRALEDEDDRALRVELQKIKVDLIRSAARTWLMLGEHLVARFLGNFAPMPEAPPDDPLDPAGGGEAAKDGFKTTRAEIGPLVEYETAHPRIIAPGETARVSVGTSVPVDGTEWPGIPETACRHYGMPETMHPMRITVPAGFELRSVYVGSVAVFYTLADGPGVPSEVLATGAQPKYPVCPRSISITVDVKNTSCEPRALSVRVLGVPVRESEPELRAGAAAAPAPVPDPPNDKVA